MNIGKFAAVIFDMDGLLLDSEVIARDTFFDACRHFGLDLDLDLFIRCVGSNAQQTSRILADGLRGRIDSSDFDRVWSEEYSRAVTANPIPLKEGVEEIIDHVQGAGVPMAVATSSAGAESRGKLRRAGILDAFRLIVGGDQTERSKPEPDIFLKAATDLDVDPTRCLAIEDSENGVRAAVAAGMTVVQVPDLVPISPALTGLGHYVVDSLLDVLHLDFE